MGVIVGKVGVFAPRVRSGWPVRRTLVQSVVIDPDVATPRAWQVLDDRIGKARKRH